MPFTLAGKATISFATFVRGIRRCSPSGTHCLHLRNGAQALQSLARPSQFAAQSPWHTARSWLVKFSARPGTPSCTWQSCSLRQMQARSPSCTASRHFQLTPCAAFSWGPAQGMHTGQIAQAHFHKASDAFCACSGKTSLLLHYALSQATAGKQVLLVCKTGSLESAAEGAQCWLMAEAMLQKIRIRCPALFQLCSSKSSRLSARWRSYLNTLEDLIKLAACLHLLAPAPDLLLLDDLAAFLPRQVPVLRSSSSSSSSSSSTRREGHS